MSRQLHKLSNQSGFSLIELMIAMTLGLTLMAGATQIMTSTRQSFRFNEGMTVIQENGRYAINLMERNIRLTGYPAENSNKLSSAFSFDTANIADALPFDSLSVQYEAIPADVCTGTATPTGIAAPTAAVRNHRFDVTANSLRCGGNPLVDGIDAMQIQYGIDTDADSIPNLFVNATDVIAGITNPGTPDWNNVISIRVAILVNSINQIQAATNRTYVVLDRAIPFNDGLARRVFTTTIPLRNRAISNV
jgi:type IV pilus assembly protein PilW